MNKIYRLFILSVLFCSSGIFVFADEPSSSLDDKPSVDTAASSSEVPPSAATTNTTAADAHTSYLYDLKKLIEKSRENIKEVNQKIKEQAVLKRNQKREERAREYYEKGVELTNEGKLDEAREYFEKAIRITEHPEMSGYIRESQSRLKKQEDALHTQERERFNQIKQDQNVRQEDVEEAYKAAVDLYKQKKYHPAKDAFEHVDEIAPDYRATDSYLKIIDQDIITADAVAAKQQTVEIERQQNEAEQARAKEKAMWLQQIEEKEKERKEAIDKQAEDVYDEAVDLYKNKQFAAAKKKFEEVSWVIPDYKATMKYLGRIDRDAQIDEERVAKEQQKALQDQRWEEAVEQKKREAQQQRELEAKELQHKKDLEEQAAFLYTAAVNLFDNKEMDEALEKFNDIDKTCPGFKSTRVYIARIKQWQFDHQQHQVQEQTRQQQEGQEEKRREVQTEVNDLYLSAVDHYKAHDYADSKAEFLKVEDEIPDYKSTEKYLTKIDRLEIVSPPVPVAVVAAAVPAPVVVAGPVIVAASVPAQAMPAQVKVAISVEDQQRQTQEIVDLAAKSAQLYREVADVSNDRSTQQTERKIAEVNNVLNDLKNTKEHVLRQMREEEWRRQQEQARAEQEEHRAEAEKMYQNGVEYLRSHDYKKAKIQFLELENVVPDYKATRRYLSRIEKYQKEAGDEAVTTYEKNQEANLKQLQDKENAEELRRVSAEQEKQQMINEQQAVQLQDLTQKASAINDDIIRLSHEQDYDAMKEKFAELENTVTALVTLKDEMTKDRDNQEREKQLVQESVEHRNEELKAQQQEDRQIHAYDAQAVPMENRSSFSNQSTDVDLYKHREIMQEQNMLFSEGVDRYEHKKYSQAKLLFGELADQNDRRAEVWLKKVDRAITRELLKSQEGEESERTAFIADQLRAQRELSIIQERERQRQKKLTEELERQKRLYEDDQLVQLQKEQTMKIQVRERERQEEKRLQLEQENKKQQEMFRFHKVTIVVKPPETSVIASEAKQFSNKIAASPSAPRNDTIKVQPSAPPALTAKQVQAQVDFSNKRKVYLDRQFRREQRQKEREARIKAAADARQKRIEEREKEKERQKELRAQQAQAEADKLVQEKKHQEEFLREQTQEREEKIKQDEIVREETKRQADLESQERQRQAQLEIQREAVRKQLEEGVEAMYQEALSLYKQGDYTAAADKFKDIQDILPGYKRSEQYMDEARQKSLAQIPQAAVASNAPPASPAVSHQDDVSKALDLFDPNAK